MLILNKARLGEFERANKGIKNSKPVYFTNKNVYVLKGELEGFMAMDVSPEKGPKNEYSRGSKRLIFNHDKNGKHKVLG